MIATRLMRHISAPRTSVYRALLDPSSVARWKVPAGMSCCVHAFDAREGGSFRISLTYDVPTGTGKTNAQTDTYRGIFLKLIPNEQVVEVDEFETTNPAFRGEMTITMTLADAEGGGTDLVAVHEGLPPGLSPVDNERGWQMALAKLAALVEAQPGRGQSYSRKIMERSVVPPAAVDGAEQTYCPVCGAYRC